MTETEEEEFWYSNPWHNITIPRYGHKVTYINKEKEKIERELESRSRFSRVKENYLNPIISYLKTIKIKPIKKKINMKRIINKIRRKFIGKKYTACILFFRAKGLTDEEILQEMLNN